MSTARKRQFRMLLVLILAAAISHAICLLPRVAFAIDEAGGETEADDGSTTELRAASADALRASDYSLLSDSGFPAHFDLRDRGVVTPVKRHELWNTSWAFAATAATETSILSKMGSTYAETDLDLSERYLAWYVASPVTDDISASQAGEGLHAYSLEPNSIFEFGGKEACAATLYAQGIGPVPEADYPYRGLEGRLAYDNLLQDKEGFISFDTARLMRSYPYSSEEDLRRRAEEDYDYYVEYFRAHDVYSPLDDWSIGDPDEPGSGKLKGSSYTLTDNNSLIYWVQTVEGEDQDIVEDYGKEPIVSLDEYGGHKRNLYQDSIDQIKAELFAGRGISVRINQDAESINYDTWSVYNDSQVSGGEHGVCIVGWDDDYLAPNFLGNGAWICKNSWGSETDAIMDGLVAPDGTTKDANSGSWGIVDENGRHTGYFYLSYFDSSISSPESFDFDIRENHDLMNALQMDYLPACTTEWFHEDDSPIWEANVFAIQKDMRVDEVATRIKMTTQAPITGFSVIFELYRLRDGATTPDDGELLATCTREFEHEGYHRASLDSPVYLKAGERLGIVVHKSHSFDDGSAKYCMSAQESIAYKSSSLLRSDPVYGTPVVNEGESFFKISGTTDSDEAATSGWVDMCAPFSKSLLSYLNPDLVSDPSMAQYYEAHAVGKPIRDFYNCDNFCIKAFGVPVSLEHVDAVPATCEKAGNVEHWHDPLTDAIFSDERGTQALDDPSISPLGHDWGAWTVTKEATETAEGLEQRICSHDKSHVETRTTPVIERAMATLTFDLNGGTYKGSTKNFIVTARVGDTITIPDAPTRKGYSFRYWKGSNYHPGDAYKVTADHTFVATWKPNKAPKQTCSISFKANGGTGTMDRLTAKEGKTVTLPACAFKRTGFVFAGWNTNPNGKGTSYANRAKVKVTDDMTLYAQWTASGTTKEKRFLPRTGDLVSSKAIFVLAFVGAALVTAGRKMRRRF